MLCKALNSQFRTEIQQGKLVIENFVVTANDEELNVNFYLHKEDYLSQFPKPLAEHEANFEKVLLPSKSVSRIISEHGAPYYIKIDIEHYDNEILRALLTNKIYPPFISAESHTIEIFSLLVCMGYNAYKLIDGYSVPEVYKNRLIKGKKDSKILSFPIHSAGPFGNDIDGEWMTADNFSRRLTYEGLGWRDIHASRIDIANPSITASPADYCKRLIKEKVFNFVPMPIRLLKRKYF